MKTISVLIAERAQEARDIVRVVLRRPDGERLPAFSAGAHIDLFLPNGLTRQYSLINPCGNLDRYEIAVSKSAVSRGGSSYVHTALNVGDTLESASHATTSASSLTMRRFTSSPAVSASHPSSR
jgi:ferredoxin-NADP reductase